jgi:translation initiation factor IF-2
MAKMKVFELKNLINDQKKGGKPIESKDIQDFLEKNLGVKKTHSSNLEENEVSVVKKHFASSGKPENTITTQDLHRQMGNARNSGEAAQNKGQGQRPESDSRRSVNSPADVQRHTNPAADSQRRTNSVSDSQRRTNPASDAQRRTNSSTDSQRYPNSSGDAQRRTNSSTNSQRYSNSAGDSQRRTNSSADSQRYHNSESDAQRRNNSANGMRQGSGYSQNNQQRRGENAQQRTNSGGMRQGGMRQQNQGQYGNQNQRTNMNGTRQGNGSQNQRPANQNGNRMQGADRGNNRPRYASTGNQYASGQGNNHGTNQNRPRPYGQDGQRTPYRGNGNNGQGGSYNRQGSGYSQRPAGGYNRPAYKDEDDHSNGNNRSAKGQIKRGPSGRSTDRKNFDQQILDQKVAEKNDNSTKRNRDRLNKEKNYKDKNGRKNTHADESVLKAKIAPRKGQFIQPKPVEPPKEEEIKVITLPEVLTIKELADKMKQPAAALVKKLFLAGKMVSINQEITYEEAEEIALEYDIISEKEVKVNEVEELLKEEEEDPSTMVKRPPVVCVMGHVDHGKTSLLDAIRQTNVTSREAGGITQAIGASVVEVKGEKITFLDTPGHEAFTSMRMRGAQSTDIAILVVAADDGVMPQTVEAINHAKAAGVQIIVAINKIDKPSANIERVKQELTEYELIAEDWGGDTIFVPVSAHTKEGIEQLLEMILLTAEILELKANPNRNARGVVIEAKLDKGRGPVATVLVQKGTLHIGDNVAVGASYGKVRAMVDDKGKRVKEALPSTPVEIIGLNEVPDAGEIVMVTDNEKEARNIAETFISQSKVKLLADTKAKLSLDGLFSQIKAGNIKELNLIIKADVQGSVEAMKQSLVKLSNDEVAVRIIHGGVGAINESDVILASASNAIIIGFNVKPDNSAKETAERENVDVRLYRVIYNAIDDIEAAMKGLLDPVFEEKIIGHAQVRQTFKASGVGVIAGAYVLDGKIIRDCKVRIYRDNTLIHEGDLSSLKRFQDDVKEVAAGYECGLVFDKFNDVKVEDQVEFYMMVEVPR